MNNSAFIVLVLASTILGADAQSAKTPISASKPGSAADEYDLSESELNTLGYQLLYGEKNPPGAVQIFTLNSQEHASSSNAFDSLAEAYQVAGDKELARTNYKNALEIDPANVHARTMLTQLGN